MEQAVALVRSGTLSASYTPSQRNRKSKMGTRSPTYTDGKDGSLASQATTGSEEESDPGEVLMFHGIILRSQLVEMIKNKSFFDEKDRVKKREDQREREGEGN